MICSNCGGWGKVGGVNAATGRPAIKACQLCQGTGEIPDPEQGELAELEKLVIEAFGQYVKDHPSVNIGRYIAAHILKNRSQ